MTLIDLAEFVGDYLAIETEDAISDREIAYAYAERVLDDEPEASTEQYEALAASTLLQIPYYR